MPATPQEITALLNELAESLKPAILVLIDQIKPGADREKNLSRYKYNAGILDKWFRENAVDKTTGEVVYTLKNLRKAVSATKASLDWIVAPKMRGSVSGVQSEGNKVSREIPDFVSTDKLIKAAEERKQADVDARILNSVSGLIAGHRSYPHSASFKQRDQLRAEFERLKTAKTKPIEIEKAIRKMISSFPERGH